MKHLLLGAGILLILCNVAWALAYRSLERVSLTNDGAATECAVKTGWRYNCADGTQGITCEAK